MWKPGTQKPSKNEAQDKAKSAPVGGLKAGPSEVRATTKSALTSKTLAMKFMQRKNNAAEEKRNAIQQQKKNDTWVLDDDASAPGKLVCTKDVADPSLPPVFGRRSFGYFNKGVEDEYREVMRQIKFAAAEERELEEEVSAQEMTSRMIKYTGLMRGPQGNRPPKKQRRN